MTGSQENPSHSQSTNFEALLAGTSPVILAFLKIWEQGLRENGKDTTQAFTTALVASHSATGEEDDVRRSWMMLDWLVREYIPTWLRFLGLEALATRLEALAPIADASTALLARPGLAAAQGATSAHIIGSAAGSSLRTLAYRLGLVRSPSLASRATKLVPNLASISVGQAALTMTEIAARGSVLITDGPKVAGAAKAAADAATALRARVTETVNHVLTAAAWNALTTNPHDPEAVLRPQIEHLGLRAASLLQTAARIGDATIREVEALVTRYGEVLEAHAGMQIPESLLPAPREAIKYALLQVTAHAERMGNLTPAMLTTCRNGYIWLHAFVPDAIAATGFDKLMKDMEKSRAADGSWSDAALIEASRRVGKVNWVVGDNPMQLGAEFDARWAELQRLSTITRPNGI
jgi:hypothetical protein